MFGGIERRFDTKTYAGKCILSKLCVINSR
jgi:hypothetical protein